MLPEGGAPGQRRYDRPVSRPSRLALPVLVFALVGTTARSQTPAPAGSALGRAHLWVNLGTADLSGAAGSSWGVGREDYFGLEAYGRHDDHAYYGGGFGRLAVGRTTNADGDTIRDFQFLWLELNGKWAFASRRAFTFDAGLGAAFFYVEGQEVSVVAGEEVTDPLADLGFGLQAFVDGTWRVRRLLLGLEAEYQLSYDVINIDYSSLRLGGHVGVAF
jgi:hypothetical protein